MHGDATVTRTDVAIIGGGMVGASLALALSTTGVSTLLVEGVAPGTSSQPSFDDRTTALGNASRRIFQGLGVWERMAAQAGTIRAIHVSDAGRFGFARLHAAEQGIEAFGYVISNRVIGAALWEKLRDAPGVQLRVPAQPADPRFQGDHVSFTLHRMPNTRNAPNAQGAQGAQEQVSARLLVAADGAHSLVRQAAEIDASVEDYGQVAVVTNVASDRPHDGTAYERFTQSGPLAVLPLHDGSYGVIWTCTPERAGEVLSFDDATFLRELQGRFGWRAGQFVRAGRRASYPLKLTRAATTVGERTVLIGNAAQALHPVAGQGFNLGLRDAAMLAEVLAHAHRSNADADAGAPELLRRFADWRQADRRGVVRFTDGLVKLFGDSRPAVGWLRNLGLLLFDLTPPAKSALARVSAGFAGPTPRLARGLSLG
ncbi:MAG TPA: 2-octaprenyl-6-methoxyphenyl hydroxylase [Steroidobacteraceae bacterium]|nr:2-octaprenyl-6-methoxyphenyl hydroxylase [Steroidobacteraceae bacterium]